ncbi:MAG: 50S ribosomal protein L29 [Gammaproteobacteria bacterium]
MDAAELRKKNPEDLDALLMDLLREQFNLRMQKGSGQLSKPNQMKVVRRDIARIKTVLKEMSAGKST